MKDLLKQLLFFILGCLLLWGVWRYMGRDQPVGELGTSKWQCASYTPFIEDEAPWQMAYNQLKIPRERVEADLKVLAEHFDCVRLYSVTGLSFIPEIARATGLKLMLGAWVNGSPKDTWKEIRQMVLMAKDNQDVVKAVIVGNETLLRKEVSDEELVDYIRYVKKSLPKMPVTYADVWEFWLKYPKVAPVVDFVTIHILPYWEDEPVGIDNAIPHVEKIYNQLQAAFPDKKIMIGETGWPSFGRMREEAFPSLVNQAKFVRGVVALAHEKGWDYNLIEAFDQKWKRNSEGAVGGNWGLFFQDRKPKPIFNSFVSNYPYQILLLCSVGLFLLMLAGARFFSSVLLNWKTFIILSVTSFVLVYQAYEFFYASRYVSEWVFGAIFLLLGFLVALNIENKNFLSFRMLFIALVLHVSLTMLFDARYRMFPWAGLVPLALATVFIPQNNSEHKKFNTLFGILLVFVNFFILINETIFNWQSNLWVIFSIVVAICLLYPGLSLPLRRRWVKALCIFVIAVTAASLVRYRLMEPAALNDICRADTIPWWCTLRQNTGLLIHFRFFERIALSFAVLSLVFKRPLYFYIGVLFSGMGMVLYNFDFAALAFVVCALYLALSPQVSCKNSSLPEPER
ncbi:beta (1-6) glucans synthase [bacterium]|nr:beta (1-6) glucans synthase [bacterium]